MHAPSWTSGVIIEVEIWRTRKRVPDRRGASELTVPNKVRPRSSAAAYTSACVSCWRARGRVPGAMMCLKGAQEDSAGVVGYCGEGVLGDEGRGR